MRLALVCVIVLAHAGVARAQSQPADRSAEAQRLAEQGLSYYKIGKYPEAITFFEQAYLLQPVPGLLYNLAQAYRLKGDCAEALRAYRGYLRDDPGSPQRTVVEAHIAEMEKCKTRVVEPPAQTQPASVPVHPPPAARGGGLRTIGIVTMAAGAVLGLVGAYFAIQSANAASDVNAFLAAGGTWNHDIDDRDAEGRRDQTLAIVFSAVGAVAVVGGGVVWIAGWREGSDEAQPRGYGAMITGRWAF